MQTLIPTDSLAPLIAPAPATPTVRPGVRVAVVMEREANPNQWQEWRYTIADVVLHEDAFGTEPRVLRDDGQRRLTLFPGFTVELFRDEAPGYALNLESGAPVWFVVWRIDDEDPSRAWVETVSVSYHEAGRWLDAQERVDNRPLSSDVTAWLQAFTTEHHQPEPKRRRRPQSFLAPEQRQ